MTDFLTNYPLEIAIYNLPFELVRGPISTKKKLKSTNIFAICISACGARLSAHATFGRARLCGPTSPDCAEQTHPSAYAVCSLYFVLHLLILSC